MKDEQAIIIEKIKNREKFKSTLDKYLKQVLEYVESLKVDSNLRKALLPVVNGKISVLMEVYDEHVNFDQMCKNYLKDVEEREARLNKLKGEFK